MEMVESFTPDVMVLGYALPVENGLQFYRELVLHRARPIGCVMITGYPWRTSPNPRTCWASAICCANHSTLRSCNNYRARGRDLCRGGVQLRALIHSEHRWDYCG